MDILNEFIAVLIRLMVIYALLGVVSCFVIDYISILMHRRHYILKRAIRDTIGEPLEENFFNHCLIKPLGRFPSYVPLWLFPIVLANLLEQNTEKQEECADDLSQNKLTEALSILREQEKEEESRKKLIEKWFQNILENASDSHKAWVRIWIWIPAFVLTFFLRFDTVRVVNKVFEQYFSITGTSATQLSFPLESIGYIGYILTALLISISGMIAFEVLNRYVSFRGVGRWTGK